MSVLLVLLSLLAPALVTALFLSKTLHFVAALLGQHLRRSSRTRCELLLARVATETKAHEADVKNKKREDDDWEQVGTTPPGSAVKHGQMDSDWDGIVGFFHPFWYAWQAS
jgi:alpha-1,2-mannosyltransferase